MGVFKRALIWSTEAEDLSGSVIKVVHAFWELVLAHTAQIPVFRKNWTDQAIRVFIHPKFKARILTSKVDSRIEILCHPFLIIQFPAIAIRRHPHASLVRSEPTGTPNSDGDGGLLPNPLELRKRGLTFHQGHKNPTMNFPDHPTPVVPNPLSDLHNSEALPK